MKIRYIKDAKTSWFDFEMPRKYEWDTKMSCHQDYGYYIVGIARRILHKWKLIEYFYDLVDPIVFLIQQINDTKSSIEMNKRYLKKEAGYLIQHRKKIVEEKLKNVEDLIKSIEKLENELPDSFKYSLDDLNQIKVSFESEIDNWKNQRGSIKVPINKMVLFLWDRLDKTPLSSLEKRKFILFIFTYLKYRDYDSVPERTALKRIYQLLYREWR